MSFADLADPADAHIQGLCVATCSVQHFRGQFHHQARALGFALEGAGVVWVIVHRQPLVVLTLQLHVGVSRTLLGTEITRVWRAILRNNGNM